MSAIGFWLWLASETEVSPRSKAALVAHYGGAEAAFHAPVGEFFEIQGISQRDAAILEKRDMGRVDAILERCQSEDIRVIAINDAEYPLRLKSIFAPPTAIFVKGRLPNVDDVPAIAVVGTRRASPYGLKMGRSLAFEIAKCGAAVISGLTSGVDEAAARGALLAGGVCIGVLGTGHGSRMSALERDISSGGALISEYPPGTKALRSFFRDRNRVASGLSAGVVVVEAPAESGALLFAAEAREQGREIFAVPGNADSEGSAGAIGLLKQGAKPVTCGWDVMEEFASMFPGKLGRSAALCPQEEPPARSAAKRETAAEPEKVIDKKKDSGYIDLTKQLAELSDEQLKIIAAIDRGGSHIDDIIENTELSAAKVLSQLTILEIKGYIRRDSGRRVVLNTAKK